AIAAGDVLGMGYRQGERLIERIESDARQFPDRPRILYVTSADSDAATAPGIASNLEELHARMAPFRSHHFRVISRLYPNEGHYDVALPALTEALELIFPKADWSAKYRDIMASSGSPMENLDSY